jgi:putative transposase
MLRSQYNFRLAERIEAYEQVRCPKMGEYCDIKTQAVATPLTCSVNKFALYGYPWTKNGKRRSACNQQDADLIRLKEERPWYKEVNAQVLGQMLRQLDTAFQNFFKSGKGYPVFKRRSHYRSFTYPPGCIRFDGNKVRLPGIGWMRFFNSRSFPNSFSQKSVTVRRKADGYYISVRLEDSTVPEAPNPNPNQVKKAVGVDLGIKKLMALSTGETIPNLDFYQQQERRRRIRQRRAARKAKGSKRRAKAYQQVAKLEHRVACCREDMQWKVAHQLTSQFDLIVFEDLNIQRMKRRCKPKVDEATGKHLKNGQSAKKVLNRLISNAAWGELKRKVCVMAVKSGAMVHEVNPKYTSQMCSQCGYTSPTNRDKERFICESCGFADDADCQAAVNILNRGLAELGINFTTTERNSESYAHQLTLPL